MAALPPQMADSRNENDFIAPNQDCSYFSPRFVFSPNLRQIDCGNVSCLIFANSSIAVDFLCQRYAAAMANADNLLARVFFPKRQQRLFGASGFGDQNCSLYKIESEEKLSVLVVSNLDLGSRCMMDINGTVFQTFSGPSLRVVALDTVLAASLDSLEDGAGKGGRTLRSLSSISATNDEEYSTLVKVAPPLPLGALLQGGSAAVLSHCQMDNISANIVFNTIEPRDNLTDVAMASEYRQLVEKNIPHLLPLSTSQTGTIEALPSPRSGNTVFHCTIAPASSASGVHRPVDQGLYL
jgi:hypothetical protein